MAVLPGLEGIDIGAMWDQALYWIGFLLFIGAAGASFFYFYYMNSFRVKLMYWPLYGSGDGNRFTIGRPVKNRLKKTRDGMGWKKLYPLFNKKIHEPFDDKYIYPGNNVYAFEVDGELIPAKINVYPRGKEGGTDLVISPVPHYIRNWQSVEYKRNQLEFSEHSFWEENKYFFMVVITAGICFLMVTITVYYTFKYAGGSLDQLIAMGRSALTSNAVPQQGVPPGG